ncbi:MAG: PD-(D/E)XK nuclease family protein [Eubacteriales bacterium]|nr:PD-(D/E)XK nuclease family protein [Eubacteriales bacterium]
MMGRAGTGKTTAILQRIAAQADSGKRQILIVPELASHEYERLLAQETGNKGARYAEVLTFRRIANRVFSEAGGLADTALTPAGRLLVLYESVRRSADALALYREAVRKPEVLRGLMQVLDEMKCNKIAPEDMLRVAQEADGHLAAKLGDLGRIGAIYETLSEQDLPDPRDQLTKVAERLPDSTVFDNAEVYLDRFDTFSRQELDVLAVLLNRHVPITVALTGDSRQPDLFPEAAKAAAQLRALAGRCGADFVCEFFETMQLPRPHDLAVLERYALETTVEQFASEEGSVRLHAAGDLFSECEFAAAYIRRLLRTTDARRRDIVIAARNFEQYAPILELVLERYDIPVFLSEKHDILQKPVLALAGAALRTVTDGWRYEDMFAYLKTGFAGLTPEECDELEEYAVFWRIRGTKWEQPFDRHPDSFSGDMDETAQQKLAHLNTLREKAVQPLLMLQTTLQQAQTATQYVQALYHFLETIGAPEAIAARAQLHEEAGRLQTAEEYRQLWEIFMQALEQFAWVQGDAPMETDTFVTLLGLVLTEYDVGTIPVSLDRVTCGPIDRVCRTGIPHLIVLGVNDGVLPSAGENGSILTDHDRVLLLGLELELETSEDRMAREQTALYRVAASAAKSLLLSWSTVGTDGEMRPSFLIGTVRRLLEGVPETNEAELKQAYRLEAERPRFDLACCGAARDMSPAAQAAWKAAPVPIVPMEQSVRGPLRSAKVVRELYGEKLRVSASRVDAFNRCQYAYFLRYGLKAKERRRAAFDAPETGTFLHFVLEHTIRDLREQCGDGVPQKEEARKLARRWTAIYVETQLGGKQRHSARFWHLFRRLIGMLDNLLDNLLDEMACSDFVPVDFELDFSYGGDLPPVVIASAEGVLEMNGKVDRVDGYVRDGALYIRVMDYKSGQKKFELSDLWYGLNIQLLLYLFAIEKHGLQRYRDLLAEDIDRIVPAGALYVPAHDAIVQAKRDTDAEELQRLRKKQLRRSGLLLDERAVIDAMEHGITKEGAYLPVGFLAKTGEPSKASLSSLADLEKMGKLSRHIRKVLEDMGRELRKGSMEAKPVRRGPMEVACMWCPYRAVCRFDPSLGDQPHNIAKIKPEEFWQSIDRELEGGGTHGR